MTSTPGSNASAVADWASIVGEAVDDIGIATLEIESNAEKTITVPSGWTLINKGVQTGAVPDEWHYDYWYRVVGGETTATWSWTGAAWSSVVLSVWRGCRTGETPVDVASAPNPSASSTTAYGPGLSITTLTAATTIIFSASNDSGFRATPPTSYTERVDVASGNSYIASIEQAAAGATGDQTGTLATASWNSAALIALASLASAAANPVFGMFQPDQAVNVIQQY